MKKLYAIVAALLVLSMGTTVFAGKSPEETDGFVDAAIKAVGHIVLDEYEATDNNGGKVDITVTPTKATNLLDTIKDDAKQAVETAFKDGKIDVKLGDNQELTADILGIVEVEAVDSDVEWPVTLRIKVDNVRKGDHVLVMHCIKAKWETIIPDEVGDGYVIATFSSFSPIAIVRAEVSDKPSDNTPASEDDSNLNNNMNNNDNSSNTDINNTINNNNENIVTNANGNTGSSGSTASSAGKGSSSATSPKTGQSVPGLFVLAVFFAGGIAVCGWRMKKNA